MAHFVPDSGRLDSAEKSKKQKRTPQTTKPSMLVGVIYRDNGKEHGNHYIH